MRNENEIASSYLPTYTYLPIGSSYQSLESQASKQVSKQVSTNQSVNQAIR